MDAKGQLHTLAALLPRKHPWYPLDKRVGGHHSQYECGGEEKKIPARAGNLTRVVQPIVYSYTD